MASGLNSSGQTVPLMRGVKPRVRICTAREGFEPGSSRAGRKLVRGCLSYDRERQRSVDLGQGSSSRSYGTEVRGVRRRQVILSKVRIIASSASRKIS